MTVLDKNVLLFILIVWGIYNLYIIFKTLARLHKFKQLGTAWNQQISRVPQTWLNEEDTDYFKSAAKAKYTKQD
jgi:hypothetical protein